MRATTRAAICVGAPTWGGADNDRGSGIATDGQGNVYVTGKTESSDFPVTASAAPPILGGCRHECATFMASYDASGHPRWVSYLGGDDCLDQGCLRITIDEQGDFDLTGSGAFPVTPGAAQTSHGDLFVARLMLPASRPVALDPAGPAPASTASARYFPTTRHTLAGPFLAAWSKLGGIPALGLPLSEPFVLSGQQVQVTERAVLVLAGGQVSLLPLGALLSAARVFAPVPAVPNSATRLYFPATKHTLSGPFLTYWQAHQGSMLLGPPIAEPDQEGLGDGTGRVYLVQWFANGRLELHPEMKDPRYRVEQGRVGYGTCTAPGYSESRGASSPGQVQRIHS